MTMDILLRTVQEALCKKIIMLVVAAIILDTIFGFIRALREHKFNSCFGIDGAIRKISMLISIAGLTIIDCLIHVNLIGFIPEQARAYIGMEEIGLAGFFGILYICYETVSVLKNMTMCGLPVKFIWKAVEKFLKAYTDELPDSEDEESEENEEKEADLDEKGD